MLNAQIRDTCKSIAEHGLDMRNPFSSIYMPEADSKKRVSIPVETIREIQQACYEIDDGLLHLSQTQA